MVIFRRCPVPLTVTGTSNGCGVWINRHFRLISRFTWEIIQYMPRDAMQRQWELVRDLSNGAIFNDLEWIPSLNPYFKVTPLLTLSEIFNYTKHRAASLWQLSFLSCFAVKIHTSASWLEPPCTLKIFSSVKNTKSTTEAGKMHKLVLNCTIVISK